MERYMNSTYNAWAEINLDNLVYNYKQTRDQAFPSKPLCVIKADAYGHGALEAARVLGKAGASHFAVATAEEALQLRRHGILGSILIFGIIPTGLIAELVQNDIALTVDSIKTAKQYAAALDSRKAKVHVKIDTGMRRIGLEMHSAAEEIMTILSMPCFEVEGIYTHFCVASNAKEDAFTRFQYNCFQEISSKLSQSGIHIPLRHCANSAAIIAHPYTHEDMVRPGLMLYGYNPCDAVPFSLRPVMTLKARIIHIKTIQKGESVSYGRSWTAPRDATIATLSIGYADGLLRGLSGKLSMLVRGSLAKQVGAICMDMCMLDVTQIPGVEVGDAVTIFGQDQGRCISADEVAAAMGTISYELFCGVGRRVPRIYLENGVVVNEMCHQD